MIDCTKRRFNWIKANSLSALDKGFNAHIQQLKQFIQQYQKVEHNLGIDSAASQADQKIVNDLIQRFGTPNKLKTK
jgi:exonuclease SbcC